MRKSSGPWSTRAWVSEGSLVDVVLVSVHVAVGMAVTLFGDDCASRRQGRRGWDPMSSEVQKRKKKMKMKREKGSKLVKKYVSPAASQFIAFRSSMLLIHLSARK
jgi:hypothetical protein